MDPGLLRFEPAAPGTARVDAIQRAQTRSPGKGYVTCNQRRRGRHRLGPAFAKGGRGLERPTARWAIVQAYPFSGHAKDADRPCANVWLGA